ncbi:Alpha/Beta hydrolase protein [Chaetomidium leptoderma]|uniref:Alpha/Beta hydrolase protein n=1 Tax=Chaetomidium leptoderma TaxID=669021 RepID=A0AAN6VNY3_9PEZI|nr:Alpha/Beta hydrolase protein [Chaetomidium leptoderma]
MEPSAEHTHTAIMLHGRGSNGPEFAEELAETTASGQKPLTQRFPGWRWVFPSSQELWSTAFEEMLPAWFEAHSLTDTTAREESQIEGIRQSVAHLQSILSQEVTRLGGETERVVVMGISQGGAIGMWTLLCHGNLDKPFGAFVGASTWLPFAANIHKFLGKGDVVEADGAASETSPSDSFSAASQLSSRPLLSTPIFLGHGVDDAVVDVELGRQAQQVLSNAGFQAEWKEYSAKLPSQANQAAMDTFEATKPDRLHQSLSSAWASFLGAQHCSREVNALRKALDEHVQQTNLSITSLRRDAANRHDLLATAAAESKSKIEQHATELKEAATLRASLSAVQQQISHDKNEASRQITELSEKTVVQQECLDALRSTTSQDIRTIQEQYRLALEKVDFLQGELREARAERIAAEHKLAALGSQITTAMETRHGLSEDMVKFLDDILARRDGLLRLLDKPDFGIPRKPEEAVQSQSKRPAPSNDPSVDIRSLYLLFRDRYKANPPKSDKTFIWEFISSIENPAMSKHIQESLAAILPEYVTQSRDTRRKNPQRHVNISKGLTWRKFREALVKIPGPS